MKQLKKTIREELKTACAKLCKRSQGSVLYGNDYDSIDFIVLYRTLDWLDLKIGHLIGWIWKCWNLLFQFCHLIGFHCLGGPGLT